MRTIETTFETFGASVLLLGFKGDSNATEILIDCEDALAEYQGTMAALSITGPDLTVYPGDISLDENGVVHWVVAARDCGIAGHGSARIDLVDDAETVVASAEASTIIMKTHMQNIAPDQIADWTEAASVALQELKNALLDLYDGEDTTNASEAARRLAETGRVNAELLRVSAESARVTAENARATAETARATAETARATAETARATAETARETAETARASAETARVSEFSTIEANAQAALSYIGPSEDSSTASAAHVAGSYFIYDGKLYKATANIAIGDTITSGTNCAQVPGGAMGEVSDLKSALSDALLLTQETVSVTMNSASSIDPATGANGVITGCRSNYISYTKPLAIKMNLSGYLCTVWAYSANSGSNGVYSPTGVDFVDGVATVFVKPVTGSNPCIRIGLKRYDGAVIPSENHDTIISNITFYSLTDTGLNKSGYPADSKATGDRISSANGKIDDINNQLYKYNAVNILDYGDGSSGTHSDMAGTKNADGSWTFDGTASATTFFNIISSPSAVPEYVSPGRKYRLKLNGGIVPVRVYFILSDGTQEYSDYTLDDTIETPTNLAGFTVRYQIAKNTHYDNVTVKTELIALQDGQDVINYNNTYNNTYNITTSPQFTTDTNGWLQAVDTNTQDETGKTDMTGAIMSMLTNTGYCHLSPGIFYVSGNIDMPDNSMLEGCGKKTIIRLLASVTSGYVIKPHAYSQIRNLTLSGSYSPLTSFDSQIGTRHGINFEAGYGVDDDTTAHCMVDNIWIENFNGSGIRCYRSSINYARGIYVSQAFINRCHTGINIELLSEFNRFVNVCVTRGYIACLNNGGNNFFTSCVFHATYAGFVMDDSDGTHGNNAHGVAVGCEFPHIGNDTGIAIYINNIINGYVFADCEIGPCSVEIINSEGIVFDGMAFVRGVTDETGRHDATITISGGNTIMFDGCVFMFDDEAPPKITISNNTKVKFTNCYGSVTGNAITGT